MIAYSIPPQVCLSCGEISDATTSLYGEHAPSAGDVTICLLCGHIMIYREGLRLDNPNAEEMHAIAGDPRLLAAQKARGSVMDRDKRWRAKTRA